jgi:hypothetical protein
MSGYLALFENFQIPLRRAEEDAVIRVKDKLVHHVKDCLSRIISSE